MLVKNDYFGYNFELRRSDIFPNIFNLFNEIFVFFKSKFKYINKIEKRIWKGLKVYIGVQNKLFCNESFKKSFLI